MAASIDGASREQISLLAGDQFTASSLTPGSFGNPLEPGKFGFANNRINIGCCKLASVDRIAQLSLDGHSHGGGIVAVSLSDSFGLPRELSPTAPGVFGLAGVRLR